MEQREWRARRRYLDIACSYLSDAEIAPAKYGMGIHCYPIPLHEFEDRLDAIRLLAGSAETSAEGLHILVTFEREANRVAAALALGDAAKPYRKSLLICSEAEDSETLENLRYLSEELELPCRAFRFLWVQGEPFDLKVVRALLPLRPIRDDPRGVWERL